VRRVDFRHDAIATTPDPQRAAADRGAAANARSGVLQRGSFLATSPSNGRRWALLLGALALIAVVAFNVARRRVAVGETPAPQAAPAAPAPLPDALTRRCQAWPQSGCAGGQKCDMFCGAEGPELGCAPDEGTLAKGAPCDETVKAGPKSCVKGTVCLGFRDGTRCAAFCDGDTACEGGKCVVARVALNCPSAPEKNRPFVLHVCK
jgi:hypothetical protein